MLRLRGRALFEPFQSESPSALLSEIGNPFSWTRFLASRGGDGRDEALSCNRLRLERDTIRGFLIS